MNYRPTLAELREISPIWFSKGAKRFSQDVYYKVRIGMKSKKPYLIRLTAGFSDMFTGKKRYHFRINEIEENGKIGELLDYQTTEKDLLNDYLKEL